MFQTFFYKIAIMTNIIDTTNRQRNFTLCLNSHRTELLRLLYLFLFKMLGITQAKFTLFKE